MVNAAFLLAVITAAITSGTDLEEIRSRSFGLADPNGNAYLTPIVWTEVDTLEVEFGLTTYSYEGRILLLQTTGVGALSGLILRDLIINVDSRGLNFSILDGDKKMLSTARPFDIGTMING